MEKLPQIQQLVSSELGKVTYMTKSTWDIPCLFLPARHYFINKTLECLCCDTFQSFYYIRLNFFYAVNCHRIITLDLNSNIVFKCIMNSSF